MVRVFNEPYESLYIKAMPPFSDRNLIDNLIQNQDLIPVDSVYRNDDSNFGVAKNVFPNVFQRIKIMNHYFILVSMVTCT